ncbi:hypothetical protein V6U90_28560 [Micromonospora sp. CPCC 206060]|uniref:hypothetical protein n=1 Tax=Micromonospora sp. CPCC 206060 TaxID=3122406 RepID=UPI002FEF999D
MEPGVRRGPATRAGTGTAQFQVAPEPSQGSTVRGGYGFEPDVADPALAPVRGPVLVLVGFTAIAASLDLLPVGAALVLAGLFPLAHRPRAD